MGVTTRVTAATTIASTVTMPEALPVTVTDAATVATITNTTPGVATEAPILAVASPVAATTDVVTIAAATEAAAFAPPVTAANEVAAFAPPVTAANEVAAATPLAATDVLTTAAATVITTTADIAMGDVTAVVDQGIDIPMDSPPPLSRHELQGASRTTGGILRGRAFGNNPNIGDLVDQDDSLIPLIGKIYLYITADDPIAWDLTAMKHRLVIKHQVISSLAKILTEIGDRHSPVRSK